MLESEPTFHIGAYSFTIVHQDIRNYVGSLPVVSSDDNYLSHGGGVSAAIWEVAGDELNTDSQVQAVERGSRELTIGDVLVTLGDTDHPVLHAITIDFRLGRRAQREELLRLYSNLFDAAELQGINRLVLPLLASSAAGFSQHESFEVFVEVLLNRSDWPISLDLVVLSDALASESRVSDMLRETAVSRRYPYDLRLPGVPPRNRAKIARFLGPEILDAARAVDEATVKTLPKEVLGLWSAISVSRRVTSSVPLRQLDRAADGRNRIVHNPGSTDTAVLRDLLRSCDQILEQAAVAAIPTTERPRLSRRAASAHELPAVPDAQGTAQVRNLHRLLMEQLDEQELAEEHERLQKLGYRGDASNCLLESCVSQNPVDLLLNHFSGRDLARMMKQREIIFTENDQPEVMARRLLAHLGFPRTTEIVDPEILLQRVRNIRSEIQAQGRNEIDGNVASLARAMERVLRTYLRFMSLGLMGVPPDRWFEERNTRPDAPPPQLDKVTMGRLVYLIEQLGREIEASSDTTVRERLRDFYPAGEAIDWIPRRAHGLVEKRNRWIHGDQSEASLAETRLQADEFCEVTKLILENLDKGAYPTVIEVKEVRFDEWGRRRVRARTSSGRSEEVFTDQELKAGEVYLMYSRTNPLRVDPLLVQAGVELSD